MKIDKNKIGEILKLLRKQNRYSQRGLLNAFANEFGLKKVYDKDGYISYIEGFSCCSLAKIELGKAVPTLLQLKYYHDFFKISYDDILK